MSDLHGDVEELARRRIQSGQAGLDVVAVLLDLLDAERAGGPVDAENLRVWALAAGFADAAPELTADE